MSATTAADRRNILLITTDQERWFADDPVPLPAHAELRRRGTTFDRFYAASVACSPARSVIYTGRHAPITGVIDNLGVPGQASMSTDIPTLGTLLGSRGYRCAYKGKWHLSETATAAHADGPLPDALHDYGFADYNDDGDDLGGAHEGHHRDPGIARDAAEWMRTAGRAANAAGTPWCLAVNLINPHDIMWAVTDEATLARNRAHPGRGFTGPPDTPVHGAHWDLPDDPTWNEPIDAPGRPSAHLDHHTAQQLWTGPPATTSASLRAFRDYYLNCLREADSSIATVLEGLRAAGAESNTVIVFTSDHGELAGAHGLFGKGPCAYDENIRLPLVIVDPEVPGGRRTSALASQVDLVPTILDLAARDYRPALSAAGVSLAPVVSGGDAEGPRDAVLFVYESLGFLDGEWARRTFVGFGVEDLVADRDLTRRGLMRTIIAKDWKFTRYFAPGDHHLPSSVEELHDRNTLELYDLRADPLEQTNLAARRDTETTARCEALDRALSSAIEREIGEDDGRWLPRWPGAPWSS